ncbi:hypothetical protein C0993_011399 [Termitomyces sp. T159_Od127]|nr:hypothetical protein C0993_011399 [Termitomyces sp. T159_Od127]
MAELIKVLIDTRKTANPNGSVKAVRKETSQPGVSSLPERPIEKPWKEKLTLRIPSKAAPKLDLPFEKVPALNEDRIVSVQVIEKSALQETDKELDRMIEKLWEAPVPISTKELLTVASGLREAMVQKLVPKPPRPKEPNIPRTATQHMVAVEKEPNKVDIGDLPGATYFIADGTQAGLPTGAVVHQDCVATYLEKIPPGEKPVVVYVARELQSIGKTE